MHVSTLQSGCETVQLLILCQCHLWYVLTLSLLLIYQPQLSALLVLQLTDIVHEAFPIVMVNQTLDYTTNPSLYMHVHSFVY